AWDESGITSALVSIEGPDGLWREVELGSGGPQLSELTKKVEVPAATPVGEYRVTAVTIADPLGNSATRELDWLDDYGLDSHFEVYDGPDREAPNVTGISFGPGVDEVDTSKGPVTLEIPIEVTDPGSGAV